MTIGNGFTCLRNDFREPATMDSTIGWGVEVYPASKWGAEGTAESYESFRSSLTACHSAIWDESLTLTDTFMALGNAICLQGDVLLSGVYDAPCAVQFSTVLHCMHSCLQKSPRSNRINQQSASFCKFVEFAGC